MSRALARLGAARGILKLSLCTRSASSLPLHRSAVRPLPIALSRAQFCSFTSTPATAATRNRSYSTAPSSAPPARARRALLYVPGSNVKMLKKALSSSEPDALILDLEDSVAANQKGAARSNVYDALQTAGPSTGSQLFVRINSRELGLDDLEIVLKSPHLDGIVIPKVDTAEDVRRVDRFIEEHGLEETKGRLKIIASVESPLSLLNLKEIATSSKRIDSLLFAAEDYCASSNLVRTESRIEMLFGRSSVVTHAKAYGLSAIDLVRTSYKGPEALQGLQQEAEEGRRLGFDGKQAIHPAQVETIQAAYTPSEKEIDRALRMLTQYDAASGGGAGAYGLEDEGGSLDMIDAPMLLQAKSLLAKAKAAGVDLKKFKAAHKEYE